MKIPIWKKYLSYFKDVSLEQTSSPYNAFLEVLLVNGRRQLTTEDAIYSYDDKYENFNHIFKRIDWSQKKGKEALVLGLGLGSVIVLLEKYYQKEYNYTAVEIDPEICLLAQKYTLKDLKSYVETINTDALLYLQSNQNQFDLLIMDVFDSAVIPPDFQTEDYLQLIKSKLNEGGILLYNRMNITTQDKFENMQFEQLFKAVFPDFQSVPIKDNIMLINDKNFLL